MVSRKRVVGTALLVAVMLLGFVTAQNLRSISTSHAQTASLGARGYPANTAEALKLRKMRPEGEILSVKGFLRNKGKNYFTDRKIVLSDENGNAEILVEIPLALSIKQLPGAGGNAPQLSDFLDKRVVISGRFVSTPEMQNSGGAGAVFRADGVKVQN